MRQTILAVLLVVLIAAAGFIWFRFVRKPSDTVNGAAAGSRVEVDRLKKYRKLKDLKPDISIISDERFQALARPSLGSQATSSGAVPRGRANPFAPF